MKAISLWEPWGSLMRTGAKTIETRSWSTHYRGPLLICAAKGGLPRDEIRGYLSLWEFQDGLFPLLGVNAPMPMEARRPQVTLDHLNFGKAVAVVDLIDCRQTVSMSPEEIGNDRPLGDYTPGRFAWITRMVRNDFKPFPVTGSPGFFEIGDAWILQHMPEVVR